MGDFKYLPQKHLRDLLIYLMLASCTIVFCILMIAEGQNFSVHLEIEVLNGEMGHYLLSCWIEREHAAPVYGVAPGIGSYDIIRIHESARKRFQDISRARLQESIAFCEVSEGIRVLSGPSIQEIDRHDMASRKGWNRSEVIYGKCVGSAGYKGRRTSRESVGERTTGADRIG